MQKFLSYWFWPNPGGWNYSDTKVQLVLAACVAMMLGYFAIRYWRSKVRNPVTRNLSGGWATASMTFGIVALVFTASRVETIQFVSMRALWVVWGLSLIAYVVFQYLKFRRRHYVVVERKHVVDARQKYLPRKKR